MIDKKTAISFAPLGWVYTGYNAPYYYYQTGDYSKGFKEMRLLEEDMTARCVQRMVELNVTR